MHFPESRQPTPDLTADTSPWRAFVAGAFHEAEYLFDGIKKTSVSPSQWGQILAIRLFMATMQQDEKKAAWLLQKMQNAAKRPSYAPVFQIAKGFRHLITGHVSSAWRYGAFALAAPATTKMETTPSYACLLLTFCALFSGRRKEAEAFAIKGLLLFSGNTENSFPILWLRLLYANAIRFSSPDTALRITENTKHAFSRISSVWGELLATNQFSHILAQTRNSRQALQAHMAACALLHRCTLPVLAMETHLFAARILFENHAVPAAFAELNKARRKSDFSPYCRLRTDRTESAFRLSE